MIITQLDANYAHWLDLFLSSLQFTNPAARTYVELVNFHPDLSMFFHTRYPAVEFAAVALQNPSRNAMAHRRVDAALGGLGRHPGEGWYIVCDVDLLFRRSLGRLVADLDGHDAGVIFRDGLWQGEYYDHLRVAAGFVAVKDARLLHSWKTEMAKPQCMGYDPSSWFYDQITLFEATKQLSLDYLAIDDGEYINRELSEEAAVWSAHVEHKELMYLRFREELDRMRRSADRAGANPYERA